jgi:hypothetical protein
MISATRARGRVGAGGTSTPWPSSLRAQTSAWRRSFAAMRVNAEARASSFSIEARAS